MRRLSLSMVLCLTLILVLGMSVGIPLAAMEKGTSTASKAAASSSSAQKADLAPVNLNTANAEELQKLPGIGPKIAQEIVKYREANGPFAAVEDLIKVKGIGANKFQKIRPRLTVE